jgi:protoporphyrinogen oxidase
MSSKSLNICIVGGGITGHAFAWFLANKTDYKITIIEKEPKAGGLAKAVETKFGFPIDQFYHFLYRNDSKNTLDFFAELGLHPKVVWNDITSAVFKNDVLFSVDEIKSLLKVKLLSPQDKFRFLVSMLRTIVVNYKKLDSISSRDYLIKLFGQNNYTVIWEPLMVAKFSEYADQVPASWIARRIQVTFFSRSNNGKTRYGYITGTYAPLFEKLKTSLVKKKVSFVNDFVSRIHQTGETVTVETAEHGTQVYDKVMVATPIGVAQKIIDHADVQKRINKFKDLNAFVVMLFMKKKFTDYFWININEADIPFTGVIELTNLTGTKLFKGFNIVYLVQYLSDKSVFNKEEALKNLPSYLKRLKPDFDEKDIIFQSDAFASGAAPIPFLNYLSEMPTFKTSQSRIYMLNSSMIYPQDRGVGNSIQLARGHVDEFINS